MLLALIVIILTSNALNSKRDISIYYSKIAILVLMSVSYINYNNLCLLYLDVAISLGGLVGFYWLRGFYRLRGSISMKLK